MWLFLQVIGQSLLPYISFAVLSFCCQLFEYFIITTHIVNNFLTHTFFKGGNFVRNNLLMLLNPNLHRLLVVVVCNRMAVRNNN